MRRDRECERPTKPRRSLLSVPMKSVACRAPRTNLSAPEMVPPGLLTAPIAGLLMAPGGR